MRKLSETVKSAVSWGLGTSAGERVFRGVVGISNNDRLRRAALKAIWLIAEVFVRTGRRQGSSRRIDRERELFGLSVLQAVDRAAADRSVSRDFIQHAGLLWTRALVDAGPQSARARFKEEKGAEPPWVLVIAPTGACNMGCPGCYSGTSTGAMGSRAMPFAELDRLIDEAKHLWGVKVIVFTGGEPLMYRSDSKDILDVVERHPDLLFLIFTNGTLIDRKMAKRFSTLGSPTACVSIEGMRESTDARRGPGAFDRVMESIDMLHDAGGLAGVSMTAMRHNCEELLSDELIDLLFFEKHLLYGFIFQYMPEGLSPDPSLMPTPQQRLWMWKRSWEVIEERRVPLFDFWNHGTMIGGCVAAGRERGYMYVDWDGNVLPCVFVPYSAGNIHEIHARGGDLNDAWSAPFMTEIRRWQDEHTAASGNGGGLGARLVSTCPVRDNYSEFKKLVLSSGAVPLGPTAASCLADNRFEREMARYGRDFSELGREIFRAEYEA